MKIDQLIAIDTHTHAEVSCCQPPDDYGEAFDDAADKYFKVTYIDLSGWSPKYFSPQLIQYANTMLKERMLFGSDFPLIKPERWLKDFEEAGFKPEVKPLILKQNAVRLLGLGGG